jgi:hypothetical protein
MEVIHDFIERRLSVARTQKGSAMNNFDQLLGCAGTWDGLNRLQVELGSPIEQSTSQLVIRPILHDTFIRIDQIWSWKDQPQSGSFLIGFDSKSDEASIHWIDTWHNGRRVMPLAAVFDSAGALIANGHFPVAGRPDWGWRIEIRAESDQLKIDMFCLDPNGTEQGYVWSSFTRST